MQTFSITRNGPNGQEIHFPEAGSFDSQLWTKSQAEEVWSATDTLVAVFEGQLANRLGVRVTHEWDCGLSFYVEQGSLYLTQYELALAQALQALVPAYLDANRKV